MTRCAALVAAALVAGALSGCESSQSTSARLKAATKSSAPEKRLQIGEINPDVRVTATTVLTDAKAKRSAAVIALRNTSRRRLAALPLLFAVTDATGRKVYSNDSPGASADLTTVPSLSAGGTLEWVNDAIVNVAGARKITAQVGTAASAGSASATPELDVSKVRLDRDPIDGVTAAGRVFNRSSIPQQRLVIFATARRAGRIVAAGRAVVPVAKPGSKGTPFTVFFVGDPAGAKLTLKAPAVNFGP